MTVVVRRLRKSERVQAQLHKRYVNKKLEVVELRDKLKAAHDASKEEQASHAAERKAWEAERRKWAEEKKAWETNLATQLEETKNKARQEALDEVAPTVAALRKKVSDLEEDLVVARERAILEYQDSAEAYGRALDTMDSMLEEHYCEGYFRGQLRSRRIAHQLVPETDHAFLDCVECPRKEVFANKHHPPQLLAVAFAIRARYSDHSPPDPQIDFALALEDWNLGGLIPFPSPAVPPAPGANEVPPAPGANEDPYTPNDAEGEATAEQEEGRVDAGVEPGDGDDGEENVEIRRDAADQAEEIVDIEE